ncbi:glycosyltransferase family 2 protein [Methylocystis echinoides]|uniref:glycosyltransferase family 2 protein n=1 Tax=Methylocystis echinoides TaxID=29468 RepID=UPI0024914B1F|nr:glycosyltransferase family 2 protein [Methylocystis echinoides]
MMMNCPTLAELPPPPSGRVGWPWTVESPHLKDREAWPRVSIITPSYNQAQFIEETIRSVLLQGYPNLEYLILDGGSDDQSQETIKKYEPWLKFWTSARDRGQSDAINRGFLLCSGEVGAWLNSDDVLLPGALACVARLWSANQNSTLVVGASEFREISGSNAWHVVDTPPTSREELFNYFRGRYMAQPSCFFSPKVFNELGGLDCGLHYAMDLDLWFKLAERGKIVLTQQKLSWMRAHEDAKTFKFGHRVVDEVETVMLRYCTLQQINHIRRQAAERRAYQWMRECKAQFRELNLIEGIGCLSAAMKEDLWHVMKNPPLKLSNVPSLARALLNAIR